MLLDIAVNGEPLARAGVEAGVVNAFVTMLRIEDPSTSGPVPASVSLTVNGFVQGPSREPDDQTAIQWGDIMHVLGPGDEIRIRVVDADDADPHEVTPMLEDS